MEDTTNQEAEQAKPVKVPAKFSYHKPEKEASAEISTQIQKTIALCADDLKEVGMQMGEIRQQGGWQKFWKAGNNVDSVAGHVAKMSDVQQKSLDLIVLLMGASNKLKEDYGTILESIEDLSQSNGDNPQVLDYLVKVRNTVKDMKDRDSLLESLITYSNDLRDSMENLNEVAMGTHTDALYAKSKIDGFAEEATEQLDALDKRIAGVQRAIDTATEQLQTKISVTESGRQKADERLVVLEEELAELKQFKKRSDARNTAWWIALGVVATVLIVFMINNWPA